MLQLFGWQLLSLTEFFLQKVTEYPLTSIYTGVVTENFCIFLMFQRAKKVVSDSPGLVDFAIGLVKSVFNLPDGQVMFFEEFE